MAGSGLLKPAADFVTVVQAVTASGGAGFPAPAALRAQLLALLEPLSKVSSVPSNQIDEARFALVAWADELIMKSSWAGREAWQRESLQIYLFRTTRAGNEFYDHLARLRPEDFAAREIFLYTLALGFEGQYQGQQAERRALLGQQYEIMRAASRLLETGREQSLSPSAYQVDIDLPADDRLGLVFWVLAILAGLGVLYGLLWLALRFLGGEVPVPIQGG